MRLPITAQLSLLVLVCSLLALMVLALATWFQNYNFITNIRLQGLSLTASLKAAQVASNLLLYRSSVQAISTRLLIQNALVRYNNGNSNLFGNVTTDLQGALSGAGSTALLLQAIVFPAFNNNTGGNYGLVNVTGDGILGSVKLPVTSASGGDVYLGDPGQGYPPTLYPHFTYSPYTGNHSVNDSTTYYGGKALTNKEIIFLGPYFVNESFSLFSVTLPVIANNRTGILGWLSVVVDARMLYDIVDSPEGLDTTGQILLIGPTGNQNKFPIDIRHSIPEKAGNQQVSFVLPPQSNSTLGNRHSESSGSSTKNSRPFPMRDYPAVVDSWTKDNKVINNAGSMISTTNEERKQVSVGYATVNSPLVDWTLVFEQDHSEVVSPINHLRDVVLACVFGTAGALCLVIVPIAWFSIAPIRQLRAATFKTVEPYQVEGSSDSLSSPGTPEDFTPGGDGDEESLTPGEEARKEGFFGKISRMKKSRRKLEKQQSENSNMTRRRSFRIPGKVPESKHFIHDELTDLTSKFNEMSEELAMQYERLEERVKERTAELEQSKKNAEVANESKTLFIANISHELKTPLNGILGLCAVCMQEEDINKVRSTLGTIYKSGDLLLHLLTDLLTFSKNQIGQQLQIDESEFRLSDLGVQLMPIFEKQAREANVNLEFLYQGTNDAFGNTDSEVDKIYGPSGTGRVRDMCLWGDKNRILQVLMNFTSNSLKFTPAKGSIVIRVRCIGLKEEPPTRVGSSTRKTSVNSRRSKQSKTSKTSKKSKSSSERNARTSNHSLPPAGAGEETPTITEDSKLSINVAGGTTQIAKVVERRRSVSPGPLNTKNLAFEFEVEDTGPGIPNEQQQKIFEPFVQGDLGLSKKYGGTGLGLSICVQLAGLMGGGITLSSKVGEGSTFMMQIPLRFVSERAGSFASSHGRIDSRASSIVGQALCDGNSADRDRGDSKGSLNSYNGDVLASDKLADVPRIVGFTQPYLAKETINDSPKNKLEKMKKAETEAAKTGRKVRVLVAEDNQVNQEVVLRMLKLEDVYDVTIAKDGQEALDKVRASMDSDNRFNLVFMDVQMPNLDGIQSTKLIREMGFTAPIVALTAFAEKSNEEMCIASGMDHFLPKPIRRPALKQVLKKYCATIPEEEGEGSTLVLPKLKSSTGKSHGEGSPNRELSRVGSADYKNDTQVNGSSTPMEERIREIKSHAEDMSPSS